MWKTNKKIVLKIINAILTWTNLLKAHFLIPNGFTRNPSFILYRLHCNLTTIWTRVNLNFGLCFKHSDIHQFLNLYLITIQKLKLYGISYLIKRCYWDERKVLWIETSWTWNTFFGLYGRQSFLNEALLYNLELRNILWASLERNWMKADVHEFCNF